MPPAPQLACLRNPRTPMAQMGERAGSGKISLSKGGQSGTRVFVVPWYLYPVYLDRLLGRVSPNPNGFPQLFRPDVFSPEYPWLYCQEASVEGEDLLGVDGALRAFYRRAVITAKYMPMEQGNSVHINSQMLTIPGSRFVFVGQNPAAVFGAKQTVTVRIKGSPIGGSFKLRLASLGAVGGQDVPPVTTGPIPYDATAADVTAHIRQVLGLKPGNQLDTVSVEGVAGGPWTIQFVSNVGYDVVGLAAPEGNFAGEPPAVNEIYQPDPFGLWYSGAGVLFRTFGAFDAPTAGGQPLTDQVFGANNAWFRFTLAGRPQGVFQIEATAADGATYRTNLMDVRKLNAPLLKRNLAIMIDAIRDTSVQGSPEDACVYLSSPCVGRNFSEDGDGSTDGTDRMAYYRHNGGEVALKATKNGEAVETGETEALSGSFSVDVYVSLHNLLRRVTRLEVVNATMPPLAPTISVKVENPLIADMLEQNVGKVIPMGEITYQRHQVLAGDLAFFLRIVGTVNMFTFMGFPPWTLLLSGIEAKQTRLANGTPTMDCHFKFSFNPHTHQALFRPAKMRWEFVRGYLQVNLPDNVAVPTKPLEPAGGVVTMSSFIMKDVFVPPAGTEDDGTKKPLSPLVDPKTGQPDASAASTAYEQFNNQDTGVGRSASEGVALGYGEGDGSPKPAVGGNDAASGLRDAFDLLQQMAPGIGIDPDTVEDADAGPKYDPLDGWTDQAQLLGSLLSRSINAFSGTAGPDAAAAAGGIAADIEAAIANGAAWVQAMQTGENSVDGVLPEQDYGEYDPQEYLGVAGPGAGGPGAGGPDVAAIRAAIAAGVPPTADMLSAVGGSVLADGTVVDQNGGVLLGVGKGGADTSPTPSTSAVNVGAATAVHKIKIFDLGLIYGISDFTPILWMG